MASAVYYSAAGPGDTTPPVVDAWSPPLGTTIPPESSVKFNVTDETGLAKVAVLVEYPTGAYEVAWDGDKFAEPFLAGSSRSAITNGHRYTVKRVGLWPNDPSIKVIALDTSGNEAT